MRNISYFVEHKKIGDLLQEFPISRGCLYHYTSEDAATGISRGELWMTRADCFLDEEEIKYGQTILARAADGCLSGEAYDSFVTFLSEVRTGLEQTYITSFSQDPNNEYLKNNYGKHVIEFDVFFPDKFKYEAFHSVPTGQGSFAVHFFDEHYRSFEGRVIYDEEEQARIASSICNAYFDLIRSDSVHKGDLFHFVDVVNRCLILFKKKEFSPESEYRIAFAYNGTKSNVFEQRRSQDGKTRYYVEVGIPLEHLRRL